MAILEESEEVLQHDVAFLSRPLYNIM